MPHRSSEASRHLSEAALLSCSAAKRLEDSGNYEAARDALAEWWAGPERRPLLEGLDERAAAELLLRAGVLTGYIGRVRQSAGSQERAKALISESIAHFEMLDDADKSAEASIELAHCHCREGAFVAARRILDGVLGRLPGGGAGPRAWALVRAAVIENTAERFREASDLLAEVAPLVRASADSKLKGLFHLQLAIVLTKGGHDGGRKDLELAAREYATAISHFERIGNTRYVGMVENSLGYFHYERALVGGDLRELARSRQHFERAREIFVALGDTGSVAELSQNLARILTLVGSSAEAEELIRQAVEILEKGGQHGVLAEALRTQGVTLAALNKQEQALAAHYRAVNVATQISDRPQKTAGLLLRARIQAVRLARRMLRRRAAK